MPSIEGQNFHRAFLFLLLRISLQKLFNTLLMLLRDFLSSASSAGVCSIRLFWYCEDKRKSPAREISTWNKIMEGLSLLFAPQLFLEKKLCVELPTPRLLRARASDSYVTTMLPSKSLQPCALPLSYRGIVKISHLWF